MATPVGYGIFGSFLQGQEAERKRRATGMAQAAQVMQMGGQLQAQKHAAQMNPIALQLAQATLQKALMPPEYTLGAGAARFRGDQKIAERGFKPDTFSPEAFEQRRKLREAGRSNVNVKVENPAPSAFAEAAAKKAGEDFIKVDYTGAKDAASSLRIRNEGRKLLDQGAITGFGAKGMVAAGQLLHRIGIDMAKGDVENTQAYAAHMGQLVGKIIKQFGSGTGLSDADREYAEKIAGGNIMMDEGAIRKLLDIADRADRAVIAGWNKRAKPVMESPEWRGGPSLLVDEPKFGQSSIFDQADAIIGK